MMTSYPMPALSLNLAKHEIASRDLLGATSDIGSDQGRQRLAPAFARGHQILGELLRVFSNAKTTERKTELLRLALDFHAMHQEYKRAWVEAPQLKRLHRVIDDLTLQLEESQPGTSLYRARGRFWAEFVIESMRKEEDYQWSGLMRRCDGEPWSQELLQARRNLMHRVAKTLCQAG